MSRGSPVHGRESPLLRLGCWCDLEVRDDQFHLAFEVDDVAAAVGEVEGKGVACEPIRTDEYTGKRFVFFSDPDGLPIELYEM